MRKKEIHTGIYNDLLGRIAEILVEARTKMSRQKVKFLPQRHEYTRKTSESMPVKSISCENFAS